MEILISALLFTLGLALVIKCGDIFVSSSIWISDVTGMPRFVTGATVVSLATTFPELLISLTATIQGRYDMALGNAFGSVACNIGLAMGISLIVMPLAKVTKTLKFKGFLMILSVILILVFSIDGNLNFYEGFALMLVFIANIYDSLSQRDSSLVDRPPYKSPAKKAVSGNTIKFILGIGGLLVGARLLVDNGALLARFLGISEGIIALTLISVGSSLPEIVTTISAIYRGESSLSIGNIFGANIINMTLVLAICTFFSADGLGVLPDMLRINIPASLIMISLAVFPAIVRKKFTKGQGICILGTYLTYIFLIAFIF